MLQQTQVPRVVPAFGVFLRRFPSVAALADASLAEALRAWGTLGYPRRARDLWLAARVVVDEHGGLVPSSEAALRALPGIGPYTAAAIAAFAFDDPGAVPLDTNVARVVRRVGFGPDDTPRPADVRMAAAAWAGQCGPRVWHALMDVGALLCRSRAIRCEDCPLSGECRSAGASPPVRWPAEARRQPSFEGSLRQARGRVLAALRAVDGKGAPATGFGTDVVDGLLADGLVARRGDRLVLGEGV